MKITELEIKGVYLIDNFKFTDQRGGFVKIFSDDIYNASGINFIPREIYYSKSKKNVIRGMHFQLPPFEHAKLVYVSSGRVLDVVLDIRKGSSTYGKYISIELNANTNSIYIPIGCAHGFRSLEENSIVVYNQTSCYSKEHDTGILWNSFGFEWGAERPNISERDNGFKPLTEFNTPFVFDKGKT